MGKVSKGSAGEPIEGPGFEGRYGETEGYTIGFEKYTEHSDMTPLFVGLPNDQCQSPHWGFVVKGKLVYHTADGDIEITDGEAYYVGPGHTPESSPTRNRRVQPDGGAQRDDGGRHQEPGVDGLDPLEGATAPAREPAPSRLRVSAGAGGTARTTSLALLPRS